MPTALGSRSPHSLPAAALMAVLKEAKPLTGSLSPGGLNAKAKAGALPPVDITFEDDDNGTVVRLSAVSIGMQMSALTPVFDGLGLEVLSCSFDNGFDEAQPCAQAGCASATIVTAGGVQQLSTAERASLACGLRHTLSSRASSSNVQPQDACLAVDQQQQQQQHKQEESGQHVSSAVAAEQQQVQQQRLEGGFTAEDDMHETSSSGSKAATHVYEGKRGPTASSSACTSAPAVTWTNSSRQPVLVSAPQAKPAHAAGYMPSPLSSARLPRPFQGFHRGRPTSEEYPPYSYTHGSSEAAAALAYAGNATADTDSHNAAAGTSLAAFNSTIPGVAMARLSAEQLPSADEEEQWWCGTPSGVAVEQLMSAPVRIIHADASVAEAKVLMSRWGISGLLVDTGDGGEPGFVTKRDLLKASFRNGRKRKRRVGDAMQRPLITVQLGTQIEACVQMLQEKDIRRALVCDAAKANTADPLAHFVGVVSDAAIFRCLGLYSPLPGEGVDFEFLEQGELQRRGTSDSFATSCSTDMSTPLSSCGATPDRSPPSSQTAALAAALALQHTGNDSSKGTVGNASTSTQASSVATLPSSGPSAGGSSNGAPIASSGSIGLSRYSRAAALWEMDLSEVEMLRKIGEGSFGEVMLGNLRGTKVAVKRLHAPDAASSDYAGQAAALDLFFEREISILASIRHPNVVNFIGACHTPQNVCLVTDYCARGNLDTLLHKSGLQLDLLKRIEFATDAARGMTALHSARPNPIIHRDLKPGNLLVSARFEIKVADFGLSRIKDASHMLTSRAGIEGTIEYCAPEVLRGEPYSEKCDVWSFGVVLWELLTRRRPYSDAGVPVYLLMVTIANSTLQLSPVDPSQATPGLLVLLGRCLSQDAAARPDFLEVLQALEAEHRSMRQARTSDSGSSVAITPRVATGSPARSLSPGAALQRNVLPSRISSQAAPEQALGNSDGAERTLRSQRQWLSQQDIVQSTWQRRVSRTLSMPLSASLPWVRDAEQEGASERVKSEGLPQSGGSSADYSAEMAAAVALLHVSDKRQQQQQQQERRTEQQGERQQQQEREAERQEERKQQQERQVERQEERRQQQERQTERQEEQRLEQEWQVERQAERDEERRHQQERQIERQAERLHQRERQLERKEEQRQQQERQAQRQEERQQQQQQQQPYGLPPAGARPSRARPSTTSTPLRPTPVAGAAPAAAASQPPPAAEFDTQSPRRSASFSGSSSSSYSRHRHTAGPQRNDAAPAASHQQLHQPLSPASPEPQARAAGQQWQQWQQELAQPVQASVSSSREIASTAAAVDDATGQAVLAPKPAPSPFANMPSWD